MVIGGVCQFECVVDGFVVLFGVVGWQEDMGKYGGFYGEFIFMLLCVLMCFYCGKCQFSVVFQLILMIGWL